MNKSLKSIILGCSLLYSTVTHARPNTQEVSTAQTIIVGCIGIAAGVAALVGLGKLFNWAFYYTIDRTSLETYIAKLSYQMQAITPYLNDYAAYIEGAHLPLIINNRYRYEKYPTLTYYEKLEQLSHELHNLEVAFERKKNKNEDPHKFSIIDECIFETQSLRERINFFKKQISDSSAYDNEYKAKYPPRPQTNIIIVHREDTHYNFEQ